MRMPKPPASLKGQGSFPRSLAPILGHDNREVLTSINIDDDTIQRMEDREKQNREAVDLKSEDGVEIVLKLILGISSKSR